MLVEDDDERQKSVFLAFTRIYSGTLHRGQELYILQPRYDPRTVIVNDHQQQSTSEESEAIVDDGSTHVIDGDGIGGEGGVKYAVKMAVSDLYILMGRGVMAVESVPAGNVLGIAGLNGHILKSATISSTLACPSFRPMSFMAAPILRVAIEPFHASDMTALSCGMKLLNQADPNVEISLQTTGEYILSTAGEVHLQRCLNDLQNTFSKVKLNVSAPIVPFCETIIPPPKVDTLNEIISNDNMVMKLPPNPLMINEDKAVDDSGVVMVHTPNKACTLVIEARPLPEKVIELLSSNTALLKALYLTNGSSGDRKVHLNQETIEKLTKLHQELSRAFSTAERGWSEFSEIVDRIWAFGPKSTGTNVLLYGLLDHYKRGSVWRGVEGRSDVSGLKGYDHSIVYGFQLATAAGPLCEEPLRGVCYILRDWSYGAGESSVEKEKPEREKAEVVKTTEESSIKIYTATPDTYGPFSGQLISTMKEGCRRAFLRQPARLMSAMYTCDILATAEVLGRLYAVLGRRNGRVCAEEMREGSTIFSIQAVVPVAESFGFSEEIRKKTSGLASPQLVFSHWEVRGERREDDDILSHNTIILLFR